MSYRVRDAAPADGPDILELLPRLGAFPRPEHRTQEEIYRGDALVLRRWMDGGEPDLAVVIARDDAEHALLGFAVVRTKPDAFNGEPSAHLEALAVAEGAEGRGVASKLIERSEQLAVERGARTMTLHVFQTNRRAIALYERYGYAAEWLRYIKPL